MRDIFYLLIVVIIVTFTFVKSLSWSWCVNDECTQYKILLEHPTEKGAIND